MALEPSQWVLGAVFSGVEWPADRLRPAGTRLMMSQAIPAIPHMPTWHTRGKLCFTIFIWLAE